MSEINLDLSIVHKGITCPINYVQGTNTIPIIIRLTDYTIPTGSTIRIYIKKPSGHEVYNDCTFSGNVITINPTLQMFAEAGRQAGQIQVLNGQKILVSFPLVFDVDKNIIDESLVTDNEYNTIGKVFEQALQASQTAQQAAQDATVKATAAASSATNAAASASSAEKSKTDAAALLAETEKAKENAIASITDKCSSYAEIDKIKNVTLSGSSKGSYISVGDSASWRLSNLEIQGKSEQAALTGKNLFDIVAYPLTTSRYINLTNGVITVGSDYKCTELFMPIMRHAGKTINLNNPPRGNLPGMAFYTETQEYISGGKGSAISVPQNAAYVRFTVNANAENIQLELGDSVNQYEPYCGGIQAPNPDYPQPINSVEDPVVTVCGKNLFPTLTADNVTPNNVIGNLVLGSAVQAMSSAVLTPGKIVAPAGETIAILNGVKWVNLKPNTKYTLHAKLNVYTGKIYRLFNQANFEYSALNNGLISVPFTTDADGVHSYAAENFLYIARGGTYTQDEIIISDIQLEEGEATTYEPYTGHTATLTDVTLRSLPDGTADRLEKRDGVWGIERNVDVISGADLNGCTENNYYVLRKTGDPAFVKKGSIPLCDKAIGMLVAATGGKSNYIYTRTTGDGFVVRYAGADYAALKDTLTIQYALATPTWEPLSDALQAELNKLESHTGQTNIFTDAALQPELMAEYIQDPNKVIDGLKTEIENIKSQL